jgi:hypothetical protein
LPDFEKWLQTAENGKRTRSGVYSVAPQLKNIKDPIKYVAIIIT